MTAPAPLPPVALGLLLVVPLLLLSHTFRRVVALLARFMVAFCVIQFERKIWHGLLGFSLSLPRDLDEVLANPERFFRLLVRHGAVPEASELVAVERLRAITSEPSKNKTAGSLRVVYSTAGQGRQQLDAFCKFQTGRGMPVWLQALRQAAEPGVSREVDFYAKVHPSLQAVVRTPRPLLALKRPWLNYVLVVMEHVDLDAKARVVNDGDGATLGEVVAMMRGAAKLHSRFADGAQHAAVAWIPARSGLQFAQFVDSFLERQEPVWSLTIWRALRARFEHAPMTLVHGDCRPGNMMFFGPDRDAPAEVMFADWEAVNVGPFLWDLTYCTTLGWSATRRRQHQAQVLQEYLGGAASPGVTLEQARLDLECLTLVLAYVSRVVRLRGFWNEQGNTVKDQRAWLVRVHLAVADLDAASLALQLGVPEPQLLALQSDAMDQVQDLRGESEAREL
jgi:hypothetical protein